MTGPDRLVLDLLWLRPGRVGGTETYVVSLLDALAAAGHRLDVVVTSPLLAAHPHLAEQHSCEVGGTPGGRTGRVVRSKRRFRAASTELVHHLGGTVASPHRTLVTIYDVQVLEHPEWFHPVKRRYLERALPAAVDRADRVCVMSGFVARSLQEHLDVDPSKIRVVPPSVAAPDPDDVGESGLEGRFVLYPALTWPHKRHRHLLDVLPLLDDDISIVCTGAPGPAHAAFLAQVDESPLGHRVMHLGRVSPARLAGLYRDATALVFPSVYEGFGQPLLEAMSAGCPVVASNRAAIPEVVAGAGLVVPDDPAAWAAAIDAAGGAEREALAAAGRARAAEFTPSASAVAQIEVYRELDAPLG